jgi:hypothetical protein
MHRLNGLVKMADAGRAGYRKNIQGLGKNPGESYLGGTGILFGR